YQSDSQGGVQFVGEDRIDHTPKDEAINLKVGNAFDVVAERKQIDFEKIASNVYEVEYEVTLRNHKTTGIAVEVNEPIGGTWRILRSTHEWTKTDAWAAQFTIPVAADATSILKYRVRSPTEPGRKGGRATLLVALDLPLGRRLRPRFDVGDIRIDTALGGVIRRPARLLGAPGR